MGKRVGFYNLAAKMAAGRASLACLMPLFLLAGFSPSRAQADPSGIPKVEIESELPESVWTARKKLKFEFRNQFEMDAGSEPDGSHNTAIKSAVGAVYKFSEQFRVLTYLPYRSTSKYKRTPMRDGHYHAGDLLIGTALKPDIQPGFFNEVVFVQNLHLPTGEESRSITKGRGAISNVIVANHKISQTVDFRLSEEGALYNQSMGWYSEGNRKIANYQSAVSEYGEFDWSPLVDLTFTQYFGYVHTWYMSLPNGNAAVSHEAYLETAVSYTVHHRATIMASYRNTSDTHNAEHDWSPYRPDESTVVSALKLVF